jgi:hypothetical protein
MDTEVRMTIRLPRSAADFLDREAKENYTSRNAEIVRSIRERMKNDDGARSPNCTPSSSQTQPVSAG